VWFRSVTDLFTHERFIYESKGGPKSCVGNKVAKCPNNMQGGETEGGRDEKHRVVQTGDCLLV